MSVDEMDKGANKYARSIRKNGGFFVHENLMADLRGGYLSIYVVINLVEIIVEVEEGDRKEFYKKSITRLVEIKEKMHAL